jgi:hypothetical protein
VAHAAVAFDNGIVAVNFHLPLGIGKLEFRHLGFPFREYTTMTSG